MLNNEIAIINMIGFVVLTVTMVIIQWRSGSSRAGTEVIATYKEQIFQLKEENILLTKKMNDTITQFTADIAGLRATLVERDHKLKEYTDLLTARSPEQMSLAAAAESFMATASKDMIVMKQQLAALYKLLITTNKSAKGGVKT